MNPLAISSEYVAFISICWSESREWAPLYDGFPTMYVIPSFGQKASQSIRSARPLQILLIGSSMLGLVPMLTFLSVKASPIRQTSVAM